MDAPECIYKYIEFFFSKEDLESMMPPKSLPYQTWLVSVYDVYFDKEGEPGVFQYNIRFDPAYKRIMKYLEEIEKISDPINNTSQINEINKKIENEYKNLYYYHEIYVYAHYFFENMRNNDVFILDIGEEIIGGGITLEQFKQKIREKIKLLYI